MKNGRDADPGKGDRKRGIQAYERNIFRHWCVTRHITDDKHQNYHIVQNKFWISGFLYFVKFFLNRNNNETNSKKKNRETKTLIKGINISDEGTKAE